jgi:hypothetical protein
MEEPFLFVQPACTVRFRLRYRYVPVPEADNIAVHFRGELRTRSLHVQLCICISIIHY